MTTRPDRSDRRPGRRLADAYGSFVVRFRFAILAAWALGAVATATLLPGLGTGGGGSSDVGGLVSASSPPIQAEIHSFTEFRFPLLSRVSIVQRDPKGLDPYAQARAVLRALALDQQQARDERGLLGALPLTNTAALFPSSRERGTTAITFLFSSPSLSFSRQTRLATSFARSAFDRPDDHLVGVTGTVPGRVRQGTLISSALPTVEAATLIVIVVLVAVSFRSLIAPVVALLTAGCAFLVTTHAAASIGQLLGITVPSDLKPLIVALLIGIVTDYQIFYVSSLRRFLIAGHKQKAAATRSIAEVTPIVLVAGATVAAGVAVLVIARSPLFHAVGPGMALTIVVGVVVGATLIPAALAALGSWMFWPNRPVAAGPPAPADPVPVVSRSGGFAPVPASGSRLIRALTHRRTAGAVTAACVVALTVAALPLLGLQLGMSVVQSLPSDVTESRAEATAAKGFAPGILSPTVLLVEQPGITAHRDRLGRLQRALAQQPGVAGVVGPGQQLLPLALGAVLSESGDAARYLVVFDADPLGAASIDSLHALQARLPALLAAAGLPGARVEVAGDTALAEMVVLQTQADLGRLALAALLVDLTLLVLFLRALVAPVFLLASSALVVAAALGITTFMFQTVLGDDGLTFYVPFAAAVLLVALGSDYNIFGVGKIWEAARDRPLAQAMIDAVPPAARAISIAGLTLALSFGLLVLVPLRPFRELAVAMTVGVLLDVFVVRSLLVPSILTLLGPLSGWPSRRLLGHRAFHEARKATRHKSSQSGGRPWGQTLQTEPGQTDGVART